MTVPGPSPASPGESRLKLARRGGRMLGFYMGTGVVLALFVGGWLAWTPLWVSYWEREAIKEQRAWHQPGYSRKRVDAVRDLAALGPGAYQAVDRLLKNREMYPYWHVFGGLEEARATWALPLVIRACRSEDAQVAGRAVMAVEKLSGKTFHSAHPSIEGLARYRPQVLAWWESEGRAKYGAPNSVNGEQ